MLKRVLFLFLILFNLSFSIHADKSPFDTPSWYEFFQAIAVRDVEQIKEILDSSTDVNIRFFDDKKGQTPLMLADATNVVKLLLSRGADVMLKDDVGSTALHYNVNRDNALEVLPLLIKKGADVNAKTTKYNEAPIMFAKEWFFGNDANKGKEVMKLLIDAGADINTKDESGYTLLLYAAVNEKPELVKFLINNGANKNIKSEDGKTPLDYARELKYPDIIKLLDK
ncbi:MAG: ankyrin repeat domain-containing protein [Candidatus Aureabacteria bacterium]|nr:ankyrin repeat domain-containing protein [Candidatus Auribacterota bacterium]